MLLEDEVQQQIRIEAAKTGTILFRNNSGVLLDETGRPVRYGLCNESKKQNETIKSSDLIGITPVVITQDMVGQTVGVFTAIEVKREDWTFNPKDKREIAQKNFLDFVKTHGGIAFFCNSVDKLIELFRK